MEVKRYKDRKQNTRKLNFITGCLQFWTPVPHIGVQSPSFLIIKPTHRKDVTHLSESQRWQRTHRWLKTSWPNTYSRVTLVSWYILLFNISTVQIISDLRNMTWETHRFTYSSRTFWPLRNHLRERVRKPIRFDVRTSTGSIYNKGWIKMCWDFIYYGL